MSASPYFYFQKPLIGMYEIWKWESARQGRAANLILFSLGL